MLDLCQQRRARSFGEVCDGWRLLQRPGLSLIQERIRTVHDSARSRDVYAGCVE